MNIFLFVAGLIIIAVLIIVLVWQHRNYVKPVKELIAASDRAEKTKNGFRFYPKYTSEVGKLAVLMNKLSDKHLLEKQRTNEKNAELERCTRSLDNFAYVVSHDLKAPFNSIKSIAELLRLEYADKFDESGKELLYFIDLKVNEMDDLLMGILSYSRVRQSEEKIEALDLNNEVRQIIKEVAPPPNVVVKIDTTLPTLKMERDLAYKLFRNLIENAVNSIDHPEGFVDIGSQVEDGVARFYIRDNGMGIDMKYFEKIFNIFFTIKEQKAPFNNGSGVGLAIVKKIVEYKGGEVWVDSELKKGSTFYFTLPLN